MIRLWIHRARHAVVDNRRMTAAALVLTGIFAGSILARIDQPLGTALATASAGSFSTATVIPAASDQRSVQLVLKQVMRVPWGNDRRSLAKEDGNESASFGPMSFAIGNDGTFWLLDQIQYRLAQFNDKGQWLREIPLNSRTYDGLEITDNGSFVLLDKLGYRMVQVLDPQGNHITKVDLQRLGEPESGHITAMFSLNDGIWVEYDNTFRKRVLDEQFRPCERETIRGRPVRVGIDLLGALDGRGGANIWLEDRTGHQNTLKRQVRAEYDIARIITLDTDAREQIHAIFHLVEYDRWDVGKLQREEVYGVVYDDQLRVKLTWHSPWVIQERAQFTEIRVGKDGTIYQMGFDDQGVVIARGDWVAK